MGIRIEWRSKSEGDDAVLAVEDDSNTVLQAWPADPALLTDFLNDMEDLDTKGLYGSKFSQENPERWGELVIARSEAGDVLSVDPQLYWEGVAFWFRARGADPHPWQGRG